MNKPTRYYRERNGDYMSLSGEMNQDGTLEARASAIQGLPSSVCTTGVEARFVVRCDEVTREEVPAEWLARLYWEGDES